MSDAATMQMLSAESSVIDVTGPTCASPWATLAVAGTAITLKEPHAVGLAMMLLEEFGYNTDRIRKVRKVTA